MRDVMPGDLVEHTCIDNAMGLVIKVWYEEELLAEVLWTDVNKPKPAEWKDVHPHRACFLKIVRSNSEIFP